jgi:hypothetical protein
MGGICYLMANATYDTYVRETFTDVIREEIMQNQTEGFKRHPGERRNHSTMDTLFLDLGEGSENYFDPVLSPPWL